MTDPPWSDPRPPSLAARPTAEQLERFSRLTVEERSRWLVDYLAVCHELAGPEARERWREHRERERVARRSGAAR